MVNSGVGALLGSSTGEFRLGISNATDAGDTLATWRRSTADIESRSEFVDFPFDCLGGPGFCDKTIVNPVESCIMLQMIVPAYLSSKGGGGSHYITSAFRLREELPLVSSGLAVQRLRR